MVKVEAKDSGGVEEAKLCSGVKGLIMIEIMEGVIEVIITIMEGVMEASMRVRERVVEAEKVVIMSSLTALVIIHSYLEPVDGRDGGNTYPMHYLHA